MASLEERCASLKSTIDQLNLSLERAAASENELRSEIQSIQRQLLDSTVVSHSSAEKLKQVQGVSYLNLNDMPKKVYILFFSELFMGKYVTKS